MPLLEKTTENLNRILSNVMDIERHRRESMKWDYCSGFPFPPEAPVAWIKFATLAEDTIREAATQSFIYDRINVDGVRVPRVHFIHAFPPAELPYRALGTGEETTITVEWSVIAMDYVKGVQVKQAMRQRPYDEKLKEAIALRLGRFFSDVALIDLSTSEETRHQTSPGPVGGGLIYGPLWDDMAPRVFSSVKDLENHVNTKIKDGNPRYIAKFAEEPLRLCYTDFRPTNMLLDNIDDPNSTLTVIDFRDTYLLPVSFMYYELYKVRNEALNGRIFTIVKDNIPERFKMENMEALTEFAIVNFRSFPVPSS